MPTPPVSGVLAWYAADQITSPPASGSALASWNDLSGNGYTANASGNAGSLADVTATGTLTATTTATSFTSRTLLVAIVTGTASVPTLTDSQSNTWTLLASGNDGTDYSGVYYCIGPSVSASQTFTATAATGTVYIGVCGFDGGPYTLDQYSSATGGTPGSITSAIGDLVLTLAASSAGIPTGFTNAGGATNCKMGYIASATEGAYNPTWATVTHWSCIVSFSPPAPGPTYNTSVQNGLPGVLWGGSTPLTASIPSTAQPTTIFAVLKATGTGRHFGWAAGTATNFLGNGETSEIDVAGTSISGVTNDLAAFCYETCQINGSSSFIRINGTQNASGTVGTTALGASITLGAAGNGTTELHGYICELLIYPSALDSIDIGTVEAYLYDKWFTTTYAGTGAGSYTFTGSATGITNVTGSGTGSYTFTGTATAIASKVGTGTGTYTFTGTATGVMHLPATGAGTFTFTGTAAGYVPTPPPLPTATGYPAGSAPKPFTYCFYDALSGQFLGTLPLSQVTFGSQLLQPGTFSGILDVASQAVQALGPFDLLQTGNVALLIDYLGSFIWGGLVWTAPYDQDDTKRQVQVGATELWSWIQNQRVQATDYSAPPYSGITGDASKMAIWDATLTAPGDENGVGLVAGTYDPMLIAGQMLNDCLYYVPNANLFGGTGLALNGYVINDFTDEGLAGVAAYLASGTATPQVNYISETYPYSSMQQAGSALSQIATLGLGVGFDFMIDVGGSAGGPVTCTVNLSYPRRGRLYAQNNLVLDTQRAMSLTIPPDATQTGNTMYEQGANGALSVSQNQQPLNGGAPILERIMSRSNIQSANVIQVLQQTGAADLSMYSYALYTPTVTFDLFTGPLQLGQFILGDDVWWRIPATDGVGGTFCPRFKNGLDVEARILAWQATVADAGSSQLQVTLCEPPSYTVEGPWLPTS